MKVNPVKSFILIKPDPPKEKKIGSIIIPQGTKIGETGFYATVMAIGPGKRRKTGITVPLQVSLGDRILLSKWAGTRLFVDGQLYMVIDEEEVLGIVE